MLCIEVMACFLSTELNVMVVRKSMTSHGVVEKPKNFQKACPTNAAAPAGQAFIQPLAPPPQRVDDPFSVPVLKLRDSRVDQELLREFVCC
jgi:predicted carbohydrate-binding protein with CBM5 and CBM33 domain